MHNLHYVRTWAESPIEACQQVETYIQNWGDENNWRSIGGCVGEDGTVFISDSDARYCPEKEDTIERIAQKMQDFLDYPDSGYKAAFEEAAQSSDPKKLDWLVWYRAKKYCEHMTEVKYGRPEGSSFNIREDTVHDGEYAQFGISTDYDHPEEEDFKMYIVYVDMHS